MLMPPQTHLVQIPSRETNIFTPQTDMTMKKQPFEDVFRNHIKHYLIFRLALLYSFRWSNTVGSGTSALLERDGWERSWITCSVAFKTQPTRLVGSILSSLYRDYFISHQKNPYKHINQAVQWNVNKGFLNHPFTCQKTPGVWSLPLELVVVGNWAAVVLLRVNHILKWWKL